MQLEGTGVSGPLLLWYRKCVMISLHHPLVVEVRTWMCVSNLTGVTGVVLRYIKGVYERNQT